MNERLIRIDELVELLGEKSKQAVYNKLNRGVFPISTYKVGKSLCWKLSEVLNFINKLQPINQGLTRDIGIGRVSNVVSTCTLAADGKEELWQ